MHLDNSEWVRMRSLLQAPVDELVLSDQNAICLAKTKIRTIGELVQKSEAEMLSYRNVGKKMLLEIKMNLDSLGLEFGMDVSDVIYPPGDFGHA